MNIDVLLLFSGAFLSTVLGGIGLAALMAAIMSTASTLFVLAGFGLSRDLYENLHREPLGERHRMIVSRASQLVIGAAVTAIAIARPAAIYWISIYASALFGVGWLPSVVAGLEWRRMNASAAVASMLGGVSSFVILKELVARGMIRLPGLVDPVMIAFAIAIAIAIAVLVLVAIAMATRPTEAERRYFSYMQTHSPSRVTIDRILGSAGGHAELARQYRSVWLIAAIFVTLSFCVWGFLFLELGLG